MKTTLTEEEKEEVRMWQSELPPKEKMILKRMHKHWKKITKHVEKLNEILNRNR